jgi:BASS family bile acid:Na+ symporter
VPIQGLVPGAIVSLVATAAVFCVMLHLGLGVAARDYRLAWREPGPMLRALFVSLVAVPAIAIACARAFALPRSAEIGLVLMAISPGAPIAVRRALGGGAPASFVAALQLSVSALAVVSMPLTVFLLDHVYAGSAAIEPWRLARQVFVFQLLPVALGAVARILWKDGVQRLERPLSTIGTTLVAVLVVLVALDEYPVAREVGNRTFGAILATVALAVAAGHAMGGPSHGTRTAVAVAGGTRNVGLAMLVATINPGLPEVPATIVAYLFVSALALAPYLAWRRRGVAAAAPAGPAPQNTNLP